MRNLSNSMLLSFYMSWMTLFGLSCSDNRDIITIEGFSSEEWKKDSLACDDYRFSHYQLLKDNKSLLIGKKENALFDFLGSENKIFNGQEDKFLYYYIHKGEQCLLNKGNKLKLSQNRILMIKIRNGTVEDIDIQLP